MTVLPKAACIRQSRGPSTGLSKALFVAALFLLCLFWAVTVCGVERPRQTAHTDNPSGHVDPTVDVLLVTSTRIETNTQFDDAIAEYISVLADTEGLTAEYVELDSDECLARFGIKVANPMLWTEVRSVIKTIADANGVRYFLLLGGQLVVPRPLWDVTFQPGASEPTESQVTIHFLRCVVRGF